MALGNVLLKIIPKFFNVSCRTWNKFFCGNLYF